MEHITYTTRLRYAFAMVLLCGALVMPPAIVDIPAPVRKLYSLYPLGWIILMSITFFSSPEIAACMMVACWCVAWCVMRILHAYELWIFSWLHLILFAVLAICAEFFNQHNLTLCVRHATMEMFESTEHDSYKTRFSYDNESYDWRRRNQCGYLYLLILLWEYIECKWWRYHIRTKPLWALRFVWMPFQQINDEFNWIINTVGMLVSWGR